MTIINNEHEIKKIAIGDKIIMENKDWIPLTTYHNPFNFGSYGFFKYLGNNKAAIVFVGIYSKSVSAEQPLFDSPKGYLITQLPQDIKSLAGGNVGEGYFTLKNGTVYLNGVGGYVNIAYSAGSSTSFSNTGYPLVVSVEKI